ncbi:GbsR/MarR family transcriptional regulator [Catalinimonas niigatensis]|uniref:GbsR/MarR family transcriptional regulator n=1 Tax=Catalinimonas niigatensis TaxID=1397264 RepID=UPI002665BD21|nr:MarR family transcriptional regulator [Catalinimonas niigatensis]WPP51092.1 hypothetical protein PZB72_01620 [Catalinimonas niigatensis]
MSETELKNKVERFGCFFEQHGAPPVSARILGYLLFSNPPRRTFYEIVEFVQASKSSVSHAINLLLEREIISYTTLPGDRKRYFQLNFSNWANIVKSRIKFYSQVQGFVLEAIDKHQQEGGEQEFLDGLLKVEKLYASFAEEFPKIIQKWEDDIRDNQ